MHPALLGTDLSIPPPVNNLTSLASDFNWVEEMALLTRQGLSGAAVEVKASILCNKWDVLHDLPIRKRVAPAPVNPWHQVSP